MSSGVVLIKCGMVKGGQDHFISLRLCFSLVKCWVPCFTEDY